MQLKNPCRKQCPFSCKVHIFITVLTTFPAGKAKFSSLVLSLNVVTHPGVNPNQQYAVQITDIFL